MRATTITILAIVLLGATALAAPAGAQDEVQPPAEQPSEEFGAEIDVTEVLLDVLVTDRQGNVIIGLGPDDFVVEEDGERVPVADVSFYSNRRLAGPAPEALAGELEIETLPEDRYFILLFEDMRQKESESSIGLVSQQLDAARRAKQWAERELLPNDWVAVASYDFKLKVQSDFTRDRKALARAIDGAVRGKDSGKTWPSRTEAAERSAGPSLTQALPAGDELRKESLRIYDAVELLAEAAGDIRGRKNLIFFSTGFGQLNSFGQQTEDPRYYPPMMQALNDNNVAAYMIDLTPSTVEHAMSDAMNQLAAETGGEYFFNFNNFLTPLSQITEENNGYYLLAYQSRHPRGESGYQKVQVRTANPQFQVKTREGYVYGEGKIERGLLSSLGD